MQNGNVLCVCRESCIHHSLCFLTLLRCMYVCLCVSVFRAVEKHVYGPGSVTWSCRPSHPQEPARVYACLSSCSLVYIKIHCRLTNSIKHVIPFVMHYWALLHFSLWFKIYCILIKLIDRMGNVIANTMLLCNCNADRTIALKMCSFMMDTIILLTTNWNKFCFLRNHFWCCILNFTQKCH